MSKRSIVAASIVAIAAMSRLVPHPPNVTPIAAMALFGGAVLSSRKLAYFLPLAAMLLSDLVLGFTVYGKVLLASQPVVYVCVVATVALGSAIRGRRSILNIGLVTLVSFVMFFVVTNFSVWAAGNLYPRTWAGLQHCYVAAIPFFLNSVAGDVLFSAVLFGGFSLLESNVVSLRENSRVAIA